MQDLPDAAQGPSSETGGLRESDSNAAPAACGQGATQSLRPEDCRANGNNPLRKYWHLKHEKVRTGLTYSCINGYISH